VADAPRIKGQQPGSALQHDELQLRPAPPRHGAADLVAVDCAACRQWSPLPICNDDTCGCSECEAIRAEREA
jgi:hypothetical protein